MTTREQLEQRGRRGVLGDNGARQLAATEREREGSTLALENLVGTVLRWGSLLSVAIIVAGIAMLVWSSVSASPVPLVVPMAGSQYAPRPPSELPSGLRAGDPVAVISLGLLVLIATPVVRVASAVLYFFWKRDRAYLAITSFVLTVILVGFAVGGTR